MELFIACLKAFLVGGAICCLAELLIDKTGLTPARILTLCVVLGAALGALGLYGPFAEWAGAGATVPLPGFGNLLARGVREAVAKHGLLGALTGGLSAAAAGITAAMCAGALAAGLLSSAGAGLIVLWRTNASVRQNLAVTAVLYGVGVACGIAVVAAGVTF